MDTPKAKRLVPSFSMFSRNIIISREKYLQSLDRNEKNFIAKFNKDQKFHKLVGIHVLAFLVEQECVRFKHNDKDIDISFHKE